MRSLESVPKIEKVPASYLFDPAPEKERAVCPAEAERVRHGVFDFRFAGLVGDQVHAGSVGIGILQVDGGRQDLVAQRQNGNARLQSARAAKDAAA